MDFKAAQARSRLYSNIRQYFSGKGYLEVETPTLSPDLIPEATIDNFGTQFINEFSGSREMYMIPSPEIFIKKLLAQGSGSLFPCTSISQLPAVPLHSHTAAEGWHRTGDPG